MIQRIQTVYFLGALALLVICFFAPMAEILTQIGNVPFNLRDSPGSSVLQSILSFISGITIATLLASIFRFKNRKQQMKLTVVSIVLFILIFGLAILQIAALKKGYSSVSLRLALIFPLISAILTFLGYRGIKKDEELVRSYERLR